MDIARQAPEWKLGKPRPTKADGQQNYTCNDYETLHDVINLHS